MWSDEKKEEVRILWKEGFSANEIAEKVGAVSRNAIVGLVHRHSWQRGNQLSISTGKRQHSRRFGWGIKRLGLPKPTLLPPALPSEANKVTLLELTNSTCRFPLGAQDDPVIFFCGAEANNIIHPYCIYHQRCATIVQTNKRAA